MSAKKINRNNRNILCSNWVNGMNSGIKLPKLNKEEKQVFLGSGTL